MKSSSFKEIYLTHTKSISKSDQVRTLFLNQIFTKMKLKSKPNSLCTKLYPLQLVFTYPLRSLCIMSFFLMAIFCTVSIVLPKLTLINH